MADTITTALSFVFSTLNNDATLKGYVVGVYQDIAPQGSLPDYCVIGVQSPGADTLTANAYRILAQPLVRVVVSGPQADMSNLSAAYARVDTLLHPGGQPLRNPVAGVLACYRESALYLPEPELINSEAWVNLGGLYRLICTS